MSAGQEKACRWSVVGRILAGTLGAYALTALATVMLSLLLARASSSRLEAVTTATLASFLMFTIIAIFAFHARSALRAWGWLAGLALPLVVALALMRAGG